MKEQDLAQQVQRLIDHQAIQDVIYKYCRGMDRRDWNLVKSMFHPDAQDDHGVFKGNAAKFVDSAIPRHETIAMSMHNVCNMLIEFESDERAVAESYCIAVHRYAPGGEQARKAVAGSGGPLDQSMELTMWVRYVDVVTKRHGEWRIADRKVVWEGMRSETVPADGPQIGASWVAAKRDPSDSIYQQLRAIGRA